jgi:hypothetical protein
MTPEEAYERGQRDMRDRIIKQWRFWSAGEIGAHYRLDKPGRRAPGDVGVLIRARNKVVPLQRSLIDSVPQREE